MSNNIYKEDWVECELGEIITDKGLFSDGDWVESKDQDPNGEVRLIQLADIGDGFFRDRSSRFMNLSKAKELNCTFLEKNDILIARMPDPLGRCTFFPFDKKEAFVTVVDVAIVRPRNNFINRNFLLYQINGPDIRIKIDKLKSGSTRKRISRINLASIAFKFPPLHIQHAIVKKIEELFSSLDNGIDELKTAQEKLKIYRQAVLKKAFEGDWCKTKIGDLYDFRGGATPSKAESNYWNGNIPWASVKDIKGDYLTETQDFITKEGYENSSTNLAKKGSLILITRISPGKSIITQIDTAINQDLKVVHPKYNTFSKYSHYLFKAKENEILKLSSGTTVKGINLNNLNSIEVPNIPIEEQHQIVKEIESRLSVCDAVERNIEESLLKAESLRQSILKKAFEGKLLTDKEVEQCRQHPDYEPASVLLEKIKAEKKNQKI